MHTAPIYHYQLTIRDTSIFNIDYSRNSHSEWESHMMTPSPWPVSVCVKQSVDPTNFQLGLQRKNLRAWSSRPKLAPTVGTPNLWYRCWCNGWLGLQHQYHRLGHHLLGLGPSTHHHATGTTPVQWGQEKFVPNFDIGKPGEITGNGGRPSHNYKKITRPGDYKIVLGHLLSVKRWWPDWPNRDSSRNKIAPTYARIRH